MKILVLMMMYLSTAPATELSTDDWQAVAKAVETFAQSADNKDVASMRTILHDDFRAIVNQAFGSEQVDFMDKTLYLQLLKDGKIGGSPRTIKILSIDLSVNTAVVKAQFGGEKMIFTTFIQVVKNVKGEWQVLSDMPQIELVE